MTKMEIDNQKRTAQGRPALGLRHGAKRVINMPFRTFAERDSMIAKWRDADYSPNEIKKFCKNAIKVLN